MKVLIIDALRPKPHPTHLSVDQALEAASRVRLGGLISLILLTNSRKRPRPDLPAHAYIAYDGLRLEL